MEKLAQFLTEHIMRNGIIEQKDYGIYKYGFQTGIELLLCVLTSVFIAFIMHRFWECLLLISVFFSQRAYVQGIHMKSYVACFFLSCSVIIGGLFFAGFEGVLDFISVLLIMICLIIINALPYFEDTYSDVNEFIYFQKRRIAITILIAIITIFFYMFENDVGLIIIMYGEVIAVISAVAKKIHG